MDSPRRIYLIFLSSIALWCCMIVAAPILQSYSESTTPLAVLIDRFFSRVCHQLDDRSFHIGGHPWAVCIRCSAIYLSFFAGLCLMPFHRSLNDRTTPSLVWIAGAALPMLIDVGLGILGIHESTSTTRLITGSIFGIVLPFFIYPPLLDAITRISHGLSIRKGEILYARKTK